MNPERTVLVTGFGPFQNHEVNASWEAVKELHKRKDSLKEQYNVNLVIDHMPVVYEHVSDRVPQLWKEHKPDLVLHVGVSHIAKCLMVECRAHGTGYCRLDVNGTCPLEKNENKSIVLDTKLDVDKLCQQLNDKNNEHECKACVSQNAGRYLCEYIYYQSLRLNPEQTLFIHVPDFSVYPTEMTAKGLYDIILILLQ